MEAHELMRNLLDDAGHQLLKVFDNAPGGFWSSKCCDGMSPIEQVEHLCECYQSVITKQAGGTHDWGTYALRDKSPAPAVVTWTDLRAQAVAAALGAEDESFSDAHHFILAHDYYHVGQLCHLRLAAQPDWDPYAIYKISA